MKVGKKEGGRRREGRGGKDERGRDATSRVTLWVSSGA